MESSEDTPLHAVEEKQVDFQLFEALAKMGDAMVFVTDLEANESRWVNDRLVELTGYTLEDYRFKRFENPFIPEEDVAHVAEFTVAFLNSDEKVSGEVKNRFVDRWGGTLHVRSRMAKITWQGRPALLYWTVLDDPKRDHVEQAEHRYRSLVEAATDCIIRLREDLTFHYSNQVFQDLVQYKPVELRNRTLPSLMAETHREAFESAAKGPDRRFHFAMPVSSRQGERIWLDGTFVLITEGQDAGMWQATLRDTTEKRKIDARIQQGQRLEALGQMAGSIAHDMNNILSGVLAATGMAEELEDEGQPISSHLETIRKGIQRAGQLSSSILSYAGQGTAERLPVDLCDLVREMKPLLQASVLNKLPLEFSVSPDRLVIEGDEIQLHQVVMNLTKNAAEASRRTDSGPVAIILDGCTGADVPWDQGLKQGEVPGSAQSLVRLRVSDDGEGISPESLDRIFDPFFSTKSDKRGLGLTAVLGIVKRHRGCILVRHAKRGGTEMTVVFPRIDVQPTQISDETPMLFEGEGTVLLVDDEAPLRRMGRRVLERQGYRVLVAATGEEALEVMKDRGEQIRAVVLDQTMPGMSGQETLLRIREVFPNVPVLRTSGYSADQGERLERTAFLGKPFQNQELLLALQKLIEVA